MTNEELILQKLEYLESNFIPVIKFGQSLKELKDDMVPLGNTAVHLVIKELQEVEAGFELDDLFLLIKQTMRSTRDMIFAMRQMSSIIEFVRDLEPLMKSAVPQIIEHLDDLERRGVFRIIKSMLDVRAKVAATYNSEDIDKIGDVMVALLGLMKKLADPKAMAFLEKAAALPANIDLANSQKVGLVGMISAGFDNDVREGLGVVLELTKALRSLKESNPPA
ncbi:MAG: hypothetical protein C0403_02995 [Desulfobacterium sp.]|nr:hypothetical protein [Desulfobacterium sp.]